MADPEGPAAPALAAFVVAGGRSSRMGRDKAGLSWGGGTLLDHAVARLREVAADVRILCGPEARYAHVGLPLVLDRVRDAGPLAALDAALAAAAGLRVMLLAVDVPLVPVELLAWLRDLDPSADAVVPVTACGPEPLCAVYGPRCAGPVARAVSRAAAMSAFWDEVRVRRVREDELVRFGDPAALFRNVNSPDDYDRARPR